MSRYPTAFTEANALLAVVEGDADTAREVIASMLPGERHALIRQAHQLADLLHERNRIMEVLGTPCRWGYSCPHPIVGYYGRLDMPRGICAAHKPDAEAADFVVNDLPKEVQL